MEFSWRTCCVVLVIGLMLVDTASPTSDRSVRSISVSETTIPEVDRHAEVRALVDNGIWPVYVMTKTFLDIVQLQYINDLNDTLQFNTIEELGDSFSSDWDKWIMYFIGFAICVGVGLIGVFAMLLAGMFTPCCRCCGKCGAKQVAKDGKRSSRDRIGCSITLVIFNCILILGVACIYVINLKISDQLEGDNTLFDNIATGVNQLSPYLENTVNEVTTSVLVKFQDGSDEIFEDLYNLPNSTLNQLNSETGIVTATDELSQFSRELVPLDEALSNVTSNSQVLLTNTTVLNTSVESVKSNISAKLNACSDDQCNRVGNLTQTLIVNVDYSIVNVTTAEIAVQAAIKQDMPTLVTNIEDELDVIFDAVNNSTNSAIQEAEIMAEDVEEEIIDFVGTLEDGVDGIVNSLQNTTQVMDDVEEVIEEYDITVYIFWGIFGLATLVCLIIFTNLVGVFHGFCPRPKAKESCLRCSRAQGSRWLLASTGFTFIGYWLFIAIVMLMFFIGGLMYTEICRSIVYHNDTNSIAALDVYDRLLSEELSSDIHIAIFDTYRTCAQNVSIYTAFKLAANGYNITEMVDITALEDAIDEIKKTKVEIPTIDLTDPSLEVILSELNGATDLDYVAMTDELNKDVTTVDMMTLAGDLEALNITGMDFTQEINTLRGLASDASDIKTLASETIPYLANVIEMMPDNFTAINTVFNKTEEFINIGGSAFAQGIVNTTADTVSVIVVKLANEIISDVENELGRCRPLYDSITLLADSVCVQALHLINTLWFSLGWCIFFLIPHMILSFKLSKLFRRTEPYKDKYRAADYVAELTPVHDHHHLMNNQPRDKIGNSNSGYVPDDPMVAYQKEIAAMKANPGDMHIPRPSVGNAAPRAGPSQSPPPAYGAFFNEKPSNPWIPTQQQAPALMREVGPPRDYKSAWNLYPSLT